MNRKPVSPPKGISRIIWRLPVWMYRAHLGRLLTDHFLLLQHTGRKSGQMRYAVLEVVKYDQDTDTYFVAAGFGEKSDWFQNLSKTPRAMIQVGRRKLSVTARRLSVEEAESILLDYARLHPAALRNLARVLGYPLEETQAGYRALAQVVPILALEKEL
jgi:deazaflavin-dependent oxidoreductase (nitroreductase family)